MTFFDRLIAKALVAVALALPAAAIAQQADIVEVDAVETLEVPLQLNDPLSEIVTVVCPFKNSVDYEPGRVKCGFISVPENREVPNSRMIRLAFAQIVAEGRLEDDAEDEDAKDDDDDPIIVRDDPVLSLTGGPGVGITSYVERFLDHDMTKSRDLYVLNQRGISASEEICPFYSQTRRENVLSKTTVESERENAQRMVECFEAATERGFDLRGYNTVENARDVRALRRALGFESWNVWGISYGSHLGQMLVNVDPDGIRALVLDAIVPNDLVDLMRLHRWVGRDFGLMFDECERQDASVCDGLEDGLYAAFDTLLETPLTLETFDEEIFPSGTVTLPAAIIAFAPFQMMYEQDAHPAIPAVMQALIRITEERDPDVLQGLAVGASDGGELPDMSQAMGAAIRCNDGYTAAQAAIAEDDMAENPRFAGGIFTVDGSRAAADACVEAGLPPRDRLDYELIQTDIPTLIVNGNWDPITPPAMAERIAPGFANGRLIIVPYAGHGPTRSMSECGTQVMTDFFDEPDQSLSTLDASCLEEGVEAPEFVKYLQSSATLKLAGIAGEDEAKLALPGVGLGVLLLTIVSSFLAMLIGAVARAFVPLSSYTPSAGPRTLRVLALLSTLTAMIGLTLIGVGIAAAVEISEVSLLAGFAPPARLGAGLVMLSALLGLATIITSVRKREHGSVRLRTRVGLPLTGLAAILLALFLIRWDMTPW